MAPGPTHMPDARVVYFVGLGVGYLFGLGAGVFIGFFVGLGVAYLLPSSPLPSLLLHVLQRHWNSKLQAVMLHALSKPLQAAARRALLKYSPPLNQKQPLGVLWAVSTKAGKVGRGPRQFAVAAAALQSSSVS